MANHALNKIKRNPLLVNGLLLVIVMVIMFIPLFVANDTEFGGTDDQAEAAIFEIMPDYVPWFSPIFEPANTQMEGLMFALQATLGTGVIVYGFRYLKKRNKGN